MQITSSTFKHQQAIPARYTCDGPNLSPPLSFIDVPASTKSLALVVDDPDAPAGTWVHWTIWNIPHTTTTITENSVPAGAVEGTTSFGQPGYGGPCPPSGTHHYVFKLYALDTVLDVPSATQASGLEQAMVGHIVAHAELVGLYSRK